VDEALRDKETGLVKPPIYLCYQDGNYLCNIRMFKDSNMICIFNVKKGCSHAREKK
jgi:hypothetical protein